LGEPKEGCDAIVDHLGRKGMIEARVSASSAGSDGVTGRADAHGDGVDAHIGPGVGSVDHGASTDVDPDVVRIVPRAEEHEVSGNELVHGDLRFVMPLVVGHAGHHHSGKSVGPDHQTRAVEASLRAGPAPDVGRADL
jgi:hypothetical protein